MKGGQQLLFGGVMAALSGFILVGSILLSFTENGYGPAPVPSASSTITALPAGTVFAKAEVELQITPPSDTFAPPTVTTTFTPNPECPLPSGYIVYVVKPGDTLQSLAKRWKISAGTLAKANCFDSGDSTTEELAVGITIHVPAVIPTPTSAVCSVPRGWVTYTIQQGDYLYKLGQAVGIPWRELQEANCMGRSIDLTAGEQFFLPRPLSVTPYPSATSRPSVTFVPTFTQATPATNETTPSDMLPPTTTDRPQPPSSTATFADTATGTSIPLPTLPPAPTDPQAPNVPPVVIPTSTPTPEPTELESVVRESP